jgi:hypothetical protein
LIFFASHRFLLLLKNKQERERERRGRRRTDRQTDELQNDVNVEAWSLIIGPIFGDKSAEFIDGDPTSSHSVSETQIGDN